jgi:hypothetical protein
MRDTSRNARNSEECKFEDVPIASVVRCTCHLSETVYGKHCSGNIKGCFTMFVKSSSFVGSTQQLVLVPPHWRIRSFRAQQVALRQAVEQAAAAVLHRMAPFVGGAGRQRDEAPGVRLHVQAAVLQEEL